MASASQLQAAVAALYHNADPAVKDQANKWLEQWQQSQEAWQVCNDVLHNGEAGMEVHYFAALTLRSKVRRPAAAAALCACISICWGWLLPAALTPPQPHGTALLRSAEAPPPRPPRAGVSRL